MCVIYVLYMQVLKISAFILYDNSSDIEYSKI